MDDDGERLILWIVHDGDWHSTWVSWLPSGEHYGWYVILQEPLRRTVLGIQAATSVRYQYWCVPRLTLMCGLPGSGKTTVARQIESETGAVRLSPDEWMVALAFDLWDPDARARVEALHWGFAVDLLSRGVDVVLEHGFWSRAERDEARRRGRDVGADVCVRFLDATVDELWARLEARNAAPAAMVVIPRQILEFWATERTF